LPRADFSGFLDWIVQLRDELAIPHALGGLNVPPEKLDRIAEMAEVDPSAGGNPRPFDAIAARQVLGAAFEGRLRFDERDLLTQDRTRS
jgi:alcohol dehydrogenase class IV